MKDVKTLEKRLNMLEYDFACKRIDVEDFIRQRSLLFSKIEAIKTKEQEQRKNIKKRR